MGSRSRTDSVESRIVGIRSRVARCVLGSRYYALQSFECQSATRNESVHHENDTVNEYGDHCMQEMRSLFSTHQLLAGYHPNAHVPVLHELRPQECPLQELPRILEPALRVQGSELFKAGFGDKNSVCVKGAFKDERI